MIREPEPLVTFADFIFMGLNFGIMVVGAAIVAYGLYLLVRRK